MILTALTVYRWRVRSLLARSLAAWPARPGAASSQSSAPDSPWVFPRAPRRSAFHGWPRRVRRGLYLVLPLEAQSDRAITVEDPWILADELFSPCYIGGWSAAQHWGLTEQIFRSVFVVTEDE